MIRRQASLGGASGFSQNTGLPALDRREDLLLVRRAPGGDQHRVDVGVRDEVLRRRVHGGAGQARRDLAGAGRVDIGDRHHGPAGEDLGDPADVVLADHAGADHADPDGHELDSPPIPTLRR